MTTRNQGSPIEPWRALESPESAELEGFNIKEARWPVPYRVECTGEELRYALTNHFDDEDPKKRGPTAHLKQGLLAEFMELHDATPQTIVKFARRWGVLELCKHGFPQVNAAPARFLEICNYRLGFEIPPCVSVQLCVPAETQHSGVFFLSEPISAWRHVARSVREILSAVAFVAEEKLDEIERLGEEWQRLAKKGPEAVGARIAFHLQFQTDLCGLRPRLSYSGKLNWRITVEGLYQAIILQTLLVASGRKGLATCSACNGLYTPNRRPTRERDCFCNNPACKKEGRRRASDRHREKLRNQA